MNGRDAIRTALGATQHLLTSYLSDLSDADLLVRPVPGANHIAWQMGHLTVAEANLVKMGSQAFSHPELPSGFAEQHSNATTSQETPTGFSTRAVYLDLFNKMRNATIAGLAKLSDADLDAPTTGRMAEFAPNLGAILLLTSNHTLMHAGQFTVVRRKLGKPVLF